MPSMTPMESMATTISLDPATKELLRAYAAKGESYDAVVRRLLEDAGWAKLDARWNKILSEDEFIPLEAL
jgi:hypothetical protein